MRRADRLFQIIQLLRYDRVTTARVLAVELEVSERTIYRDVQDLSLSGMPIEGEAGVGYRLMRGFHLPPLMFSEEELAALILGARMVKAWTDKTMARAANQAMSKIEAVLPEQLRPEMEREEILVPDFSEFNKVSETWTLLRVAIKKLNKVEFDYNREDGEPSHRTVLPLGLFYWGKVWTLVAWCELRNAYRHFRLDRMKTLEILDTCYEILPDRSLQDYMSMMCEE